MRFKNLDIIKANAVLLYITAQLEKLDKSDFLTIFKILYFADQKHLVQYGRPILTDNYVRMKNGPVPSILYDFCKMLRNGGFNVNYELMLKSFTCEDYFIYTNAQPDMTLISPSELECLDTSLKENQHLTFKELSEKSHDSAWHNTVGATVIDVIDIARAGGASEDMIKYIIHNEECANSEIF